jgi:hypothetical protein
VKDPAPSAPREVLIVSSANWHGLGRVPRYLSLAGAKVSALAVPGSFLEASSFVAERFPASEDADETLERLRRLFERRRYSWVILGDDVIVDRAVQRRDEAWIAALLPTQKGAAAASALISKCAFSRAMGVCGVPMAPGRAASGYAEVSAAARELGFPVMVKPDLGFSGGGLFSADSDEELAALAPRISGDYIVERKLPGEVGGTAVLFDRGRPAWWFSFLKVGVFPAPYGPSCRRLPMEPPGLEPILESIGAALGLHGFFGVDWILPPGGRLSVIELNGRPIPMAGPTRHFQEALPAALDDFLSGRSNVRRPPTPGGPVVHAMPASFQLACHEKRRLFAAGLLLGISGWTDTPWRDHGLLRKYAGHLVKTLIWMAKTAGNDAPS